MNYKRASNLKEALNQKGFYKHFQINHLRQNTIPI